MEEKNIIIRKTARYFTLGEINDKIENIWFICHGYGHLANYFLRNFQILDNGKNLLIGPEGLHRFYLKDHADRVGASWMTREDRLNDIKDYTNFLDDLYKEILGQFKGRKVKINVLGFSQGAATVCRWLANNKSEANTLVLWAGAFPNDIPFEANKDLFNAIKVIMVVGDKDQFITSEQVREQEMVLKQNDISYEMIEFEGKHEINKPLLAALAERI